jgi:predicted dienelactone hydrolase
MTPPMSSALSVAAACHAAVLRLVALTLATLLLCTFPAESAEVATNPTAPLLTVLQHQTLPIQSRSIILKDTKRGKSLPLHITYPVGGELYPVMIFSHGFAGSGEGYGYLASYWAEHGFVCLEPTHADSFRLLSQQHIKINPRQFLLKQGRDKQAWIDRAADISLVIDSLPTIQPETGLKLDANHIAVGGHSYGAFTSMLIGGARLPHAELAPAVSSVADNRVKAIVAMSPQGVGTKHSSLSFSSKDSYDIHIPAMYMTGDRDGSGWNTTSMRQDAYNYSPPGDKYYVSINGANHMTFSGRIPGAKSGKASLARAGLGAFAATMPDSYGDDDAHRKLIQEASTLFLDAYLRDDAGAKTALEHGALSAFLGRDAAALHK